MELATKLEGFLPFGQFLFFVLDTCLEQKLFGAKMISFGKSKDHGKCNLNELGI